MGLLASLLSNDCILMRKGKSGKSVLPFVAFDIVTIPKFMYTFLWLIKFITIPFTIKFKCQMKRNRIVFFKRVQSSTSVRSKVYLFYFYINKIIQIRVILIYPSLRLGVNCEGKFFKSIPVYIQYKQKPCNLF